uniref:Uncharacterized protein n=1 Tax=Populus trichocarpa TaxID=3694 RepID=A9P979_POPTR|nr:unknown [Populus trichocarpa]
MVSPYSFPELKEHEAPHILKLSYVLFKNTNECCPKSVGRCVFFY